jgi:hypothetical protein
MRIAAGEPDGSTQRAGTLSCVFSVNKETPVQRRATRASRRVRISFVLIYVYSFCICRLAHGDEQLIPDLVKSDLNEGVSPLGYFVDLLVCPCQKAVLTTRSPSSN